MWFPVTQENHALEKIRYRQGPGTVLALWEAVLLEIKALLSASQWMLQNTSGNIGSNWYKKMLSNFRSSFDDHIFIETKILNDCPIKTTLTNIWTSHVKTSSISNVLSNPQLTRTSRKFSQNKPKELRFSDMNASSRLSTDYLQTEKTMHRQDLEFIEKIWRKSFWKN